MHYFMKFLTISKKNIPDIFKKRTIKMKFLSISSIVSCHICPIRFILEQDNKPKNESEYYTIAKQISYHLGEEIDAYEIWDEIKTINPDISEDARLQYSEWIKSCKTARWPRTSQNDIKVSSKKMGIYGVVDRYFDSKPHLGLTRLSPAPETGIYKADRVRSALFSFCAKETLGINADEVILEYIPSAVTRTCKISPRDRREALLALKTARKILAGYVPVKNKTFPCENCYLKDKCTKGPVKLSDLL